jgi:mRNA interferase RelE/StbE
MFRFFPSANFRENLSALTQNEQRLVNQKLKLLQQNPRHNSLRTQKYRSIEGMMESSVNMDIRITWRYYGKGEIVLIAVGHHEFIKSDGKEKIAKEAFCDTRRRN